MTTPTPTEPTIVVCSHCDQQNRLPLVTPPGHHTICGRCKEPLSLMDLDPDADGIDQCADCGELLDADGSCPDCDGGVA